MKKHYLLTIVICFMSLFSFSQSGTLDTSFDGDGTLISTNTYPDEKLQLSKVRNDGKIFSLGTTVIGSTNHVLIKSFNEDGTLNTAFDGDGIFVQAMGTNLLVTDLEFTSDGKLVVSGGNVDYSMLMKINANGGLDNTFGINGIFNDFIYSYKEQIKDILITTGDEIYALGNSYSFLSNVLPVVGNITYLAKITANGTFQNTFSDDGVVTVTEFSSTLNRTYASQLLEQADGKIVIMGIYVIDDFANDADEGRILLSRVNTDGTIDMTFSDDGYLIYGLNPYYTSETNNFRPQGIRQLQNENTQILYFGDNDTYYLRSLILTPSGEFASQPIDPIYVTGTYNDFTFLNDNRIALLTSDYDWLLDQSYYYLSVYDSNHDLDPNFTDGVSGTGRSKFYFDYMYPGSFHLTTQNDNKIIASLGVNSAFNLMRFHNNCAIPTITDHVATYDNPCINTAYTVSAPYLNGGINDTYNWSIPSGWNGNSTSSSITFTTDASATGQVSVTATNVCGTSAPYTFTLTQISTPPSTPTITGGQDACLFSNENYSANAAGSNTYEWIYPSTWGATVNTSGLQLSIDDNIDFTVQARAVNLCGVSQYTSVNIVVNDAEPIITELFWGTLPPCENVENWIATSVENETTYNWSFPASWTIINEEGLGVTKNVTFVPTTASGTVQIYASNSCGNSYYSETITTISQVPQQPSLITGLTEVCAGTSENYSVDIQADAIGHEWLFPSDWILDQIPTPQTPLVTVGTVSGVISVSALNSCGSSEPRTINVIARNGVPITPSQINSPLSIYCSGTENTFTTNSAASIEATSYTWSLPSNWSGTSTTESISATTGTVDGQISVSATNACGTSGSFSISVNSETVPNTPGTITGNTNPCVSSSQTYSISAVSGATSYTWTMPSGWTGTSTTPSITTTVGNAGGTISVTANNNCTSPPRNLNVGVKIIPATPGTISGDSQLCVDSVGNYSIAAVSGATGYIWTIPTTWSGSSTTNSINLTAGTANGTLSVASSNECGSSATSTVNLAVVANPATPTITSSPSILFCSVTGSAYQWYLNGNPISGATAQNYAYNGQAGFYSVRVYNSIGCYATSTFTVGVEEENLNNSISIYPNPNNGSFLIDLEDVEGIETINIYNNLGQLIGEIENNGTLICSANETEDGIIVFEMISTKKVSVSLKTKGIYFVDFTTEKTHTSKKVVVQ